MYIKEHCSVLIKAGGGRVYSVDPWIAEEATSSHCRGIKDFNKERKGVK